VFYFACWYKNLPRASQAVQHAVITQGTAPGDGYIIHPSAMPPGSVLFIQDDLLRVDGNGYDSISPTVLKSAALPPCTPFPRPLP
jgi:hypothetical protein